MACSLACLTKVVKHVERSLLQVFAFFVCFHRHNSFDFNELFVSFPTFAPLVVFVLLFE